MKRVIKNQKKMKNAMYIVFGTFALALFAITRINPSYADNGLMIDDALDAIVLYGEVETATEDENVYESQDEEEEISEVENEGDEYFHEVPDDEENMDVDEDEINVDVDGETIDSDNINNVDNSQEEKGEDSADEKENEQQPEIQNPEVPSIENDHGVDDNTSENDVKEDKTQDTDNSKTIEYEQSEIGGFIRNPENDILGLGDNEVLEIESEEIYGTGEYEGVKVEVYAQTGAFPLGTILSIVPITGDNEISDIQDVLEEQKNVEKTEKLIAFDITFLDPDTEEELQPLTGTVQVSFNYEENEELKAAEENEEQEVKVYHLNDKDEEGEKVEEIKDTLVEDVVVNEEKSEEKNVMVVETESFSVYTIVVQVKEEQLINFEYGMVSIANPSNSNQGITIMDRNLGATMTGGWIGAPIESYGYHYQWGNNYGFDSQLPSSSIKRSYSTVNVSSYDEYYSSVFVALNTWMSTWKNLWPEKSQGPCPEGWHIPTNSERNTLKSYYNSWYGTSFQGFMEYFNIPFAGYRSTNGSTGEFNSRTEIWTSTANGNYPYVFGGYSYYSSTSSIHDGTRNNGMAASIRCFKDSYEGPNNNLHTITFDYRGGNGSTAFINVKHGSKGQMPSMPTRWNSNFLGWYLSGTDTEFDFTGTTITENISLYAKWLCNNLYTENENGDACVGVIPYNFDANGGFFLGDESNTVQVLQYFCDESGCSTNINLQNPDRVSQDVSQQSGWMFAGWYMKSGINDDWGEEFNPQTATTTGVYAKWLPFNDISIKDGDQVGFIIMDRNLGAESTSYGSNLDGIGYYYQWGNNYGFSSNSGVTIKTGSDMVDASGYGPDNYYSSNVFIMKNSSSWDSNNNKNLWGGTGDSLKIRGEGTDGDRQGPCPVGYHIPSTLEWKYAYNVWNNSNEKSADEDSDLKNFMKDFKLPFAGYRYYYDANLSNQGTYGYYWSSSPVPNSTNVYTFYMHTEGTFNIQNSKSPSDGYSVRCFKNLPKTKNVQYFTETGEKISEYSLNWYSTIPYIDSHVERTGYEYLGWFESGSNEVFDFTEYIARSVILYERWLNIEGISEADTAILLNGKKFNAAIKTLATGAVVAYSESDNQIKGIERAEILPEGGVKKLISSEDSETPIFAWYDVESQKIKYYTKAKDVYMNEDSSYLYYNLKNLSSINLEEFKTDYVTKMDWMFANSFSLADGLNLDFRELNLSNVTSMANMFNNFLYQGSGATNVTINFSKMNLSNVKNVDKMFYYAFAYVENASGVTIDFSETDLSSVTNMSQMFYEFFYCYDAGFNITGIKVDFSKANLSKVEDMSKMFSYSFGWAKKADGVVITFKGADLSSVENMYQMYHYFCYGYISNPEVGGSFSRIAVDFSKANLSKLENMVQMFQYSFAYAEKIDGVKINFSETNLSNIKYMDQMFYYFGYGYNNGSGAIINGITVDFSKANIRSIESMNQMFGNLFAYTKNVTSVKINFSDRDASTLDSNGIIIDFSKIDLSNVKGMNQMFEYSFNQSKNISGLVVDFSEADLGSVTSTYNMFYDFCYGYNNEGGGNFTGITVDFSKTDMSNLENMNSMFQYAFSYGKSASGIIINFSEANLSRVTSMNNIFGTFLYGGGDYKYNITGVVIDFSKTDLSNLTSMNNLFDYDFAYAKTINGVKIDFSEANLSNVKTMNSMFNSFGYGSNNTEYLSGITIDFSKADLSNVESIAGMFNIGFGYINSVKGLKIDFTETDFNSLKDMASMFYNFCYGVKTINGMTIDFTKTDLSNVENMSYLFRNSMTSSNGTEISDFSIEFDDTKITSSLKNMSNMFASCGIEELDLSSFDTSNVTDMSSMFSSATNLKTIYVGSRFRTNNVTNSSYMFSYATSIVGGRGTTYNSSNPNDKTYARVDKLGEPGYFTKKGEGTVATLLPGQEFNAKIKTIAKGSNASYNDADIYIEKIKQGTKEQVLMKVLEGNTLEKVSTTYSEAPVYAWYNDNDKTLYYYSEANEIDMNANAMNMFSNLTKLEEVELDGIKTSSVSNMVSMFQNDTSLTGLDLSNFDASSVTNMQNMFNGCSGIKSINLSNANMSRVTNISGIFGGCSSLEIVDFSNADMRSLTSFASIFPVLPKLREVNFHKVNLSSLESTSGMFGGISSLKYADFSDANLKSVQSVVSMFGGSGLTGADFSNANLRSVQSSSSMFGGIGTLLMANFENTNMMNVTDMSSMFGGCNNLNRVIFSGANIGNVTSVYSMFGGDSKLETVDFTKVNLSKLENMSQMFGGCSGLTGMDFSKMDLSRVTNMNGLFSAALKLESVNFGDNDFKSVTNMRSLFQNCTSLEELDITKFDTSNVTNMSEMFKGAAKLKTIYVGDEFKTDSVTNSTDMFSGAVSVVGGNGTVYDGNHIDKEYARVDKSGTPGYFTLGEFSIIYNLDGGDMEDMKTSYKLGESFTIGQPTKEENVFLGWTGSNGTIPELVIEIQKGTTGDLEYTANWEINQYKIIFNTDGGNEINPISVDYNSLLSGLNLPTPTKECNEFMGWSIELPERMPAHDITLKAVWNYTCSKSSGGGGGGGGSSKTTNENKNIHNSADEEQKTEEPSNQEASEQENPKEETLNQNTSTEEKSETTVSVIDVETETVVVNTSTSNNSNYTSEQKQSYEFAKSNGITTTSSIEEAKMNTSLTRIEMAKMMSYFAINVLGKEPDTTKTASFKDVSKNKDEQYDNGVTLAYQLGIMGQNMKNNKFRPNDEVTRAEFATALSRLLYSTPEGEYKGTRKYYEPHIAKLYNEGIISKTDPEIKEKRGYVMTMFMRSVK